MRFIGLLSCQAISNGALASEDLPTEIKLLAWGDNPSLKGNIRVGPKTLATLSAYQARLGFDKVGLDYEHQSVAGHPNFKASPREYAAYGTPEVREGDGLYLTALTWTPSGRANAKNYCDLSPVVLRQEGEVVFLHSVALCPQGAVAGLEFFTPATLDTLSITDPMNPDLKKLLCSLFGCDETADEATLLAAGQAYVEATAKAAKAAGEQQKEEETGQTELAALAARLDTMAQMLDQQARSQVLADALRDGKLVPATAKALPLDQLTALVAELPAGQVPTDKRTPEHVQSLSAQLSAHDLAVAAQLGLNLEALTH